MNNFYDECTEPSDCSLVNDQLSRYLVKLLFRLQANEAWIEKSTRLYLATISFLFQVCILSHDCTSHAHEIETRGLRVIVWGPTT